ncbi:MAG: TadE/TadG family type IV pilus assembly protein [Bdellovibrio sp.]
MLNQRSKHINFIKNFSNRRGQVALFVALAFQVLFLFFAMIINVGLLVHQKINLQNSVDLAAYYGAMKQAENMNAIAHMNYQIRQSWKLLAWRYRMLGSAGEGSNSGLTCHPFNKSTKTITGSVEDTISTVAHCIGYEEAPAFCVSYVPFKPMPPNENTCKEMATYSGVKLWNAPPIIAGFQGFSVAIHNTSEILKKNATDRCKYFGSYNFILLGKFVVSFNLDQRNRMETIVELSKATSLKKDDFYDIDGELASKGIRQTLLNNLTPTNRSGIKNENIQVFNSLGASDCGVQGINEGQPAKWLTPIRIYPGFGYMDTDCDHNNQIGVVPKELSNNPAGFPRHMDEVGLGNDVRTLAAYVGYIDNLNNNYNFSVGVEKNPWCMAYVGVSASATPKIPFSPFGGITLKARAFYKPFGGRIGPWYYKNWHRGSNVSEGGQNEKTDPLLPPRVTDPRLIPSMESNPTEKALRAANYSRFIGDEYGLKTLKMLGYYGEAIFKLDKAWRNTTSPTDIDSIYQGDDAPNFDHWGHLPFDPTKKDGNGDMLAFDNQKNQPSRMRLLETAAILPDTFDAAYYSIEPDFYHNYYLRLRDGYFKGPGKGFKEILLPDLGYRKGYISGKYDLDKFSIKEQFEFIKDPSDVVNMQNLVNEKFTFTLSDWKHVLTSWAPIGLMDYSLDPNKFGKCDALPLGAEHNDPQPPTSGNCVVGGSTGYSVKMVSSDYLRSPDLTLGGDNGGSGPLMNPPPDDKEF